MSYSSLIGKKIFEVNKQLLSHPDLTRFSFIVAYELMKDGYICISEKDNLKYTILNGYLNKQNEFGAWEVSLLSVWQTDGLWSLEPDDSLTEEQVNAITYAFPTKEMIRPYMMEESELDKMSVDELGAKLIELNELADKGQSMDAKDYVSITMQKEIVKKLIFNIETGKNKWEQIKKAV
ncbi:hypothetical protein [Bacillus sp. NPDC094106]|uniref:hypothetical protein n=1 Tax=Bacillus sp. NPDC094106 TaxID=3363949 RepID=UPI00380BA84C